MATQVQWRGGSTAEHATFTGAAREITVDTQKKTLVVHDGSTAGGNPVMREDGSNSAFALGSAGAPAVKFSGDTNTGIYSPGADQVAISTNGTGRLFVDSSGNVGLGITPVANTLIGGSRGAGIPGLVELAGNGNTVGSTGFAIGQDSAGTAVLFNRANTPMYFATNGTERLRVTAAGLVGVGNSSPSYKLDVTGDIRSTATGYFATGLAVGTTAPSNQLTVGSNGTSSITLDWIGDNLPKATFSANHATGEVRIGATNNSGAYFTTFYSNNNEAVRIDSSRRLLVGTSSAGGTELIQVQGTSGGSNLPGGIALRRSSLGNGDDIGYVNFTNASGNIHAGIKAFADGTPGVNDYPGALVFSTTADGASSPTERMRIENTGRMQHTSSIDSLYLGSTQGAGTAYAFILGVHSRTGPQTGGTNAFLVYTNGNVENTNNSYGAISDIKLKENIVDANSQWDDLKSLKVRNYNLKEGQTHKQIGLIAQEVEPISPGLVFESPDRDEDGNDLGTVTKSVNYSVLYMKAVKALQEAMERIEQLEAEMAEVKAQIS